MSDFWAGQVFDKYSGIATGAVGGFLTSFISPVTNFITANTVADLYSQQINSFYRNPQIPPNPGALLDLYNRGYIDENLAKAEMRNNGCNWRGITPQESTRLANHKEAWEAVRLSMQSKPSVEFIMSAWGKGFFDRNSERARRFINRAGGDSEVWEHYIDFFYTPLNPTVAMAAKLRDKLTDAQLEETLVRNGFGHEWQRTAIKSMMQVNPGPQDWVHFAVKEALSPEIAGPIGLYKEFPQQLRQYMGWHGLNWNVGFDIEVEDQVRAATVADLHWASHWQPIAPTQALGMYHILRRNRLHRYRDAGVNVTEFTIDDVKRWLRINDYPESVRENLAALSFTPLRLVDIRSALALNYRASNDREFAALLTPAMRQRINNYNRAWAIEQFRDRGVLPEDAETQVDLAMAAAVWSFTAEERSLQRAARKRGRDLVLKAYRLGIMRDDVARRNLRELGLTDSMATSILRSEDGWDAIQDAEVAIKAAVKGYLNGSISREQFRTFLTRAGMDDRHIRRQIENADYQRDYNRIHASTAKIVGWTGQGFLDSQAAADRLQNLGWSEPDTILLLAEANSRNLKLRGQAIRAADATRKSRARELEKALKQAQKNVEVIQQAIRRQTPITTLQKFVRKGIISQQVFLNRATSAGYPLDVAQAYLRDALQTDAKNTAPKQQPASQPQSSPRQPPQTTPQQPPQELTNANQPSQTSTQIGQQVERPPTALPRIETALPPRNE